MNLKKVYEPYFKIGTSVSHWNLESQKAKQQLRLHYSSMTAENDMKPMYFLDEKACLSDPSEYDLCPALSFETARPYLEFAKESGITLRGHTLVWHGQTPVWFFKKNYVNDWNAEDADRETMLARMENYIKGVLDFVQSEYPGVISAWDVVNEAIEDSDESGWRERSPWFRTVGDDFLAHAFRFAKKYADKEVKLFYNDYNTFEPKKRDKIVNLILRPLLEEKLIDGVGMQSHLILFESNLHEFEKSLHTFGALGLEVQLTELDVHCTDPSEEGQSRLAMYYSILFHMLVKAKKEGLANITSVTFWGMKDDESWLTGFRKAKSYPMLFGDAYKKKESYYAVARVPGQVEKDSEDRLPEGDRFEFWEKDCTYEREFHVNPAAINASDENDGSIAAPFLTIQAAADRATPGTRILIHEGVYRECVRPSVGGESPERMVSFEAYEEDEVILKASEIATEFVKSEGWNVIGFGPSATVPKNLSIWATELDPEKFKGYNPFCAVNILHDRLFIEYDKTDMTTYLNRRGMVFCDGLPLKQVSLYNQLAQTEGSYWVEANGQTVHFRLPGDDDPKNHLIELTCREQCFAPKKPFLSYIKVKGITCAHAATGAPVPQRGAISCYRGHHFIIENCKIDWSNGVGIDIGNECWHHSYIPDQTLGYTVVRGCEIKDVGVCGIAGMFASHILIEDNLISGTGWQKMELSWEAGAIKVHNTTDSIIRRNIFTKTLRCDHLWMDCGNENNRITNNLFLDGIEQREAIFMECSRDGINLIDNNIFWNVEGRFDEKQIPNEPGSSGWYKLEEGNVINGYAIYGEGTDHLRIVNNLMGNCRSAGYFAKTVAFRLHGSRGGTSRDAKLYNNLFYACGEAAIKFPTKDNEAQGNAYLRMPPGYLRVIYPAPQNCLDLATWQEFFGFDLDGQRGNIKIEVDTEQFTLKLVSTEETSPFPFFDRRNQDSINKPAELGKVSCREGVSTDFFGIACEHSRIPGPFASVKENEVISIDPRRSRSI